MDGWNEMQGEPLKGLSGGWLGAQCGLGQSSSDRQEEGRIGGETKWEAGSGESWRGLHWVDLNYEKSYRVAVATGENR